MIFKAVSIFYFLFSKLVNVSTYQLSLHPLEKRIAYIHGFT